MRGLFCPVAVVSEPLETAIGMCKRATASPISGEVPGSSACPRNSREVTLQAHSQLGTSLSSCRERGREAEFAARGALGAEAQATSNSPSSSQVECRSADPVPASGQRQAVPAPGHTEPDPSDPVCRDFQGFPAHG